jgi:hypothetical protein
MCLQRFVGAIEFVSQPRRVSLTHSWIVIAGSMESVEELPGAVACIRKNCPCLITTEM